MFWLYLWISVLYILIVIGFYRSYCRRKQLQKQLQKQIDAVAKDIADIADELLEVKKNGGLK